MGLRGVQEGPELPQLLCWLEAHEVSETEFGEPGDPLVLDRELFHMSRCVSKFLGHYLLHLLREQLINKF